MATKHHAGTKSKHPRGVTVRIAATGSHVRWAQDGMTVVSLSLHNQISRVPTEGDKMPQNDHMICHRTRNTDAVKEIQMLIKKKKRGQK